MKEGWGRWCMEKEWPNMRELPAQESMQLRYMQTCEINIPTMNCNHSIPGERRPDPGPCRQGRSESGKHRRRHLPWRGSRNWWCRHGPSRNRWWRCSSCHNRRWKIHRRARHRPFQHRSSRWSCSDPSNCCRDTERTQGENQNKKKMKTKEPKATWNEKSKKNRNTKAEQMADIPVWSCHSSWRCKSQEHKRHWSTKCHLLDKARTDHPLFLCIQARRRNCTSLIPNSSYNCQDRFHCQGQCRWRRSKRLHRLDHRHSEEWEDQGKQLDSETKAWHKLRNNQWNTEAKKKEARARERERERKKERKKEREKRERERKKVRKRDKANTANLCLCKFHRHRIDRRKFCHRHHHRVFQQPREYIHKYPDHQASCTQLCRSTDHWEGGRLCLCTHLPTYETCVDQQKPEERAKERPRGRRAIAYLFQLNKTNKQTKRRGSTREMSKNIKKIKKERKIQKEDSNKTKEKKGEKPKSNTKTERNSKLQQCENTTLERQFNTAKHRKFSKIVTNEEKNKRRRSSKDPNREETKRKKNSPRTAGWIKNQNER